jgi:hypothetical protein
VFDAELPDFEFANAFLLGVDMRAPATGDDARSGGCWPKQDLAGAEVADEPVGPNFTELWISIDPDVDYQETIHKIEKVVYAPVITLRQISLSPEDVQDLRNVQPFVLTTPDIPDYDIQYIGKEKVDDIGCYAFSVKPKIAPQ